MHFGVAVFLGGSLGSVLCGLGAYGRYKAADDTPVVNHETLPQTPDGTLVVSSVDVLPASTEEPRFGHLDSLLPGKPADVVVAELDVAYKKKQFDVSLMHVPNPSGEGKLLIPLMKKNTVTESYVNLKLGDTTFGQRSRVIPNPGCRWVGRAWTEVIEHVVSSHDISAALSRMGVCPPKVDGKAAVVTLRYMRPGHHLFLLGRVTQGRLLPELAGISSRDLVMEYHQPQLMVAAAIGCGLVAFSGLALSMFDK